MKAALIAAALLTGTLPYAAAEARSPAKSPLTAATGPLACSPRVLEI